MAVDPPAVRPDGPIIIPDQAENDALGVEYAAPNEWPLLSEDWDGPVAQMQLEYVDPATEEEPR